MRHGVKINHLGRTSAHRKSMLANMACQLIMHKRIITTLAKARALRVFVEPLLTKAKEDNTHQRRVVFSYLQDKDAIKELFGPVSEKIASRPGGYTRIIKLGTRMGDNAETALIELVDFNTIYTKSARKEEAAATRRTRRSGAKKKTMSEKVPHTEEAVVEDNGSKEEEAAKNTEEKEEKKTKK